MLRIIHFALTARKNADDVPRYAEKWPRSEPPEVLEKSRNLVADGLLFYAKIKAMLTTDKMEEMAHHRIRGNSATAEYGLNNGEFVAQLVYTFTHWVRNKNQGMG